MKQRHDKQRKEEDTKFKTALEEKDSEIQVLREMIKSQNVQLKAREKDVENLRIELELERESKRMEMEKANKIQSQLRSQASRDYP